ncbi:hypothetical protein [Nitrosomonas communis]|uniref:hypothetical protein n=1 Tax=Nitrosomonas communis TaxID=44574 RepID=UPI003D29006A
MVTQAYVYAYAAVSVADGELDILILPQVNSDCMLIFLDEVASRHRNDRIIQALDGAGGIVVIPSSCHIIGVY